MTRKARTEKTMKKTVRARKGPEKTARVETGRGARGSVAVIIAQCEGDLSSALDLGSLKTWVGRNPAVGLVVVEDYPCTTGKIDRIASSIAARHLSHVVVAGGSERLYGKLYRDVLARSGIEPSLVEFADIREHCALIHPKSREGATASALRLINTAVAAVAGASPMEKIEADIKPVCVVIGGGIAGISAATALASRGVRVIIVERGDSVGGLLRRLNIVFPSYVDASEFLDSQAGHIEEQAVEVRTGTEPVSVRGHVGNFELELKGGTRIEAGVIIVATGAELLVPDGLFGYGERDAVITQIEFEGMLKRGENPGSNIVMIQCVGSRNDERPYCSRICCTASIKNAVLVKQKFPASRVTILSRGFAGYAGDLDRARDMGVDIIRYAPESPPVVGATAVEVYDQISEMESRVPFDRVVLAVPMLPPASNRSLAEMLRIPTDRYGFLVEPRLKVRPEEHAPRGIFVAGSAHWPATITESIVQGYGAASRAFDLISLGRVERFAHTTRADADLCRGCGRCDEVCRHGAIELALDEDGMKRARVIAIQCVGCGVCVSVCPSGALSLRGMRRDLIDMTIEAARGI
jgi:heterodisulfide reductase subunit A